MSRILVLSNGARAGAREALADTQAIVSSDATLHASLFAIPFVSTEDAFSLSSQAVRFPPTRRVVRETGLAVYSPLAAGWVQHSNWPLARGTCPALLTAFVLAIALEVDEIEYRLARKGDIIPVSLTLILQMCVRKIGMQYRV